MKDNFKDKIFSKIEKENIEPIPESYFENRNRNLRIGIGIFILIAIIFGGFLLDDSSEFISMSGYMRGNSSYFILPNIFWILLITFLVFLGIKSLRNTKVGYRNSYFKDIAIGLVVILIGSYFFRFIGFGPAMHGYFVKNMPGISSVIYNESSWNDPSNGRLAGTIQEINNDTIKLKNIDGTIWKINIKNSYISPMAQIGTNEQIRILGAKTGTGIFKSDQIIPWFGMGMGNGMGQGGGMIGGGKGNGFGNGRGMMR